MFEKIVSLLLIPMLFFQTLVPAFCGNKNEVTFSEEDIAQLHSLHDYVEYVREKGAPAFSTATFVKETEPLREALRSLTGRPFANDDEAYLKVQMDETMTDLCKYISDNSGLDVALLFGTLPNLNKPAEIAVQVFDINTTELRTKFYELRDKAYDEGNDFYGHLLFLLGAYFSVISDVKMYTIPYGSNPDEVEVQLDVTYADGAMEQMRPGTVINTATGTVHGWHRNGMISLGFDCDVYDLLVYGTVDCWQRSLGFTVLYDILGNSTPVFNMTTRRFKFNYNDKEWMIQIWKGNYALISNGVEVGVYNRPKGTLGTKFDSASDDEMMNMTVALYHGDEKLFEKGPMMHWWMSAFKLSKNIYQPKDLTMEFTIELPDEDFLQAFSTAIDKHTAHDVTYTTDGLKITGTF